MGNLEIVKKMATELLELMRNNMLNLEELIKFESDLKRSGKHDKFVDDLIILKEVGDKHILGEFVNQALAHYETSK